MQPWFTLLRHDWYIYFNVAFANIFVTRYKIRRLITIQWRQLNRADPQQNDLRSVSLAPKASTICSYSRIIIISFLPNCLFRIWPRRCLMLLLYWFPIGCIDHGQGCICRHCCSIASCKTLPASNLHIKVETHSIKSKIEGCSDL